MANYTNGSTFFKDTGDAMNRMNAGIAAAEKAIQVATQFNSNVETVNDAVGDNLREACEKLGQVADNFKSVKESFEEAKLCFRAIWISSMQFSTLQLNFNGGD